MGHVPASAIGKACRMLPPQSHHWLPSPGQSALTFILSFAPYKSPRILERGTLRPRGVQVAPELAGGGDRGPSGRGPPWVPLARGGTCLETSAGPGEVGNGCSLSHWGGQGPASTHTELLVSVLWVGALSFYGPKGLDHLEGSKLQEALHSMVAKQTGCRCSSCSYQPCDLWHLA